MSNFSCAEANVNVFEVKEDSQFYQTGLCQMVGKVCTDEIQTRYHLLKPIRRRRNPESRVPLTPSKMAYAKSGQPRSQALSIELTSGLVNIIG
jgi:hypothetical protein